MRREVPNGYTGEGASECLAVDAAYLAHEFRCLAMALDVEGSQLGRGEALDVFEHAQVAAAQGHAASVLERPLALGAGEPVFLVAGEGALSDSGALSVLLDEAGLRDDQRDLSVYGDQHFDGRVIA